MKPEHLLVVDDSVDICDILEIELGTLGFKVTTCTSASSALQRLKEHSFDAVLTDIGMQGMDGLQLCQQIVAAQPDVPVLILTANSQLEAAVAALRVGAYDFLTKPIDPPALHMALQRAMRDRALRREVSQLRAALSVGDRFGELQGTSAPMLRLYDLLERAAQSDASLLITGESGTGKEVAARSLHERSRRKGHPFVALNCAALPETLLESELFGHVRGSFTNASADREGLLMAANGGTVLLDEIGDMPLALQPKFLRAIQERVVRPLGASREVSFDVRIIAATNRDLEVAVREGTFREDLFFRLNVIHIPLPPLRARGTDVLQLAQGFLRHFATTTQRAVVGFTPAVAERLLAYSWPGNIRELQNCIERAVALTRSVELTVDDLPPSLQAVSPHDTAAIRPDPETMLPLEVVERQHIERVLEAVGGNKREAARILGLDRKTLYRKLERWTGVRETQ